MSAFTIILPHKRNPGNDAALRIALDCLMTNTRHDFHLLMDAAVNEPLFPRVNRLIRQAQTDCIVYWSSDMFPAPGWDVPMLAAWNPDTFVTLVLVEPGVIGLHGNNIKQDFGRKPETFRRAAFETWCETFDPGSNEGWFAPYMVSRERVLALGGLQEHGLEGDHQGFTGADELLFERHKAAGGKVIRARSFAYHLQRWSEVDEQAASKREG